MLGQFQQFAILPKHIWSKHTGHKGNDLKTFAELRPAGRRGAPSSSLKFKKDEIALFQRDSSFYGPQAAGRTVSACGFLERRCARHRAEGERDRSDRGRAGDGDQDAEERRVHRTSRTSPASTRPTSSSTPIRRRRTTASCSTRRFARRSTMRSTATRSSGSSSSVTRSRASSIIPPAIGDLVNPTSSPWIRYRPRRTRSSTASATRRAPAVSDGPTAKMSYEVITPTDVSTASTARSRSCRPTFARSACSSHRRRSTRARHSTPSLRPTGST